MQDDTRFSYLPAGKEVTVFVTIREANPHTLNYTCDYYFNYNAISGRFSALRRAKTHIWGTYAPF